MQTKRLVVVGLLVAGLIAGAGLALAASHVWGTDGTVTWEAADGPAVTTHGEIAGETVDPIPDPNTVDFGTHEFHSDGETSLDVDELDDDYRLSDIEAPVELTISSDGTMLTIGGDVATLEYREWQLDDGATDFHVDGLSGTVGVALSGLPDEQWIAVEDAEGERMTAAWTGDDGEAEFVIDEDSSLELVTIDDGEIWGDPDPPDGGTVDVMEDVELSIPVSTPTGENMQATVIDASDGSAIASQTVGEDDLVSVTWPDPALGTNEWYVELDEGGETETFSFATPSTIEIRDELTGELLDDEFEVEVEFFDGGETVFVDTTDDGVLELEGLPHDTEFVVSASPTDDESDYLDRRVILPDISQAATIYMLDETETEVVEMEFLLEDQTGQFDDADTKLIISRPFDEENGEDVMQRQFEPVVGDRFDAADRFGAMLEADVRYQLRIIAGDGTTRQLGEIVPTRAEVLELRIDDLEWDLGFDAQEDVEWDFEQVDGQIRLQINDSQQLLTDVDIQIYATRNESRIIYDDIHSGPYGELTITQTIPDEFENVTSWTIEWQAQKNSTVGGMEIVGVGNYGIGIPVSSTHLGLFSAALIAFVAGMFSVRVSEVGVVITPLVALALWGVGWLPLPWYWVIAPLALGILVEFGSRGGFSDR